MVDTNKIKVFCKILHSDTIYKKVLAFCGIVDYSCLIKTIAPSEQIFGADIKEINMIQEVQKIERNIKNRRETDVPLINWWLYVLLLSWVTFGIYTIFLYFKRIGRIDKFIARKHEYYINLLAWTEKYTQEKGTFDQVQAQLKDAVEIVKNAFSKKIKPIRAGLSLLLTIVTLGIYGLIVLYKMNKAWYILMQFEQDFDDMLSAIWMKASLLKYPLSFSVNSSKKRSFGLWLFLSIITFGIAGLVWDYKIHTDPDNIYAEFHTVEDTVLQTIRT